MHQDITPNNIMFSPFFNKLVFIDFGLSQLIKEERGFKTLTFFCGTPKYVHSEMLCLLSIDEILGYVDLYYNDLVCLSRVKL